MEAPLRSFFFFNDTATTEIYTLSLHDALPICPAGRAGAAAQSVLAHARLRGPAPAFRQQAQDRKSTRLNSSHLVISYAVFCLKKKKKNDPVIQVLENIDGSIEESRIIRATRVN